MYFEHKPQETFDSSPLAVGGKPRVEAYAAWVYWTIGIAIFILALAVGITLYEVISRFRERLKNQYLTDGGPPATPTHSCTYHVGIRAERASPSFDHQRSVLKVELLDSYNRYITSIAVPCFLFKFKLDEGPMPEKPTKSLHPVFVKTMTVLQEQWATTDPNELISWQFTRRRPLTDIASARVLHDCYNKDAYIVFKYIVFYDPLADVNFMVQVKEQQIRGVHPCPPSSVQVFPVEKLTTPTEELRSFMAANVTRHPYWCPIWCPICCWCC